MRIAVIGSGISGLTSAHLLSGEHEVTLFEARDRIGGHTHTVQVDAEDGSHAIDTGFIVFNDWTYPNFLQLMQRLGVESQPSSMSFSVKDEVSGLEYNPTDSGGLFAQRRNLFSPGYLYMLVEILRFFREAKALLLDPSADDEESLDAFLKRRRYSRRFIEQFVLPMGCAIWSAGTEQMRLFPVHYFARFLDNHGMLSVDDRPTWRVLRGGSSSYIEPMIGPFRERIHVGQPVLSIHRHQGHVELVTAGGHRARFDHAIVATHSDQALRMLADPSERERRVLGQIAYQANEVVLHTDASLMPRSRRAWGAWNYNIPGGETRLPTLTYNMNILQSLAATENYLVTVNPGERIDPARVLRRFHYAHPVFTPEAVKAQSEHGALNGRRRTSFAGAYWGFGFHEDGVKSALEVCSRFGVSLTSKGRTSGPSVENNEAPATLRESA